MLRVATASVNEEARATKSGDPGLPAGGSSWPELDDDEPEPEPDAVRSTMRSKTVAGLRTSKSGGGGPRWRVLWRRRSSVDKAMTTARWVKNGGSGHQRQLHRHPSELVDDSGGGI
ncbi:hypothetical protein E2562_026862 [Oryza meyeriana var. granulata]|uniref:Uncharacterized protein n=1 Tax=Oryza meyeriana var. granulata TaxID=110450 RepID=A0A6G1D887_9ORYZ|nr:hypothetical protein E2562_026862 [Oryza meyeriana var. granulata]